MSLSMLEAVDNFTEAMYNFMAVVHNFVSHGAVLKPMYHVT